MVGDTCISNTWTLKKEFSLVKNCRNNMRFCVILPNFFHRLHCMHNINIHLNNYKKSLSQYLFKRYIIFSNLIKTLVFQNILYLKYLFSPWTRTYSLPLPTISNFLLTTDYSTFRFILYPNSLRSSHSWMFFFLSVAVRSHFMFNKTIRNNFSKNYYSIYICILALHC